jgi:hypothetical protein
MRQTVSASEKSSQYSWIIDGWGRAWVLVQIYQLLPNHAGLAIRIGNRANPEPEW